MLIILRLCNCQSILDSEDVQRLFMSISRKLQWTFGSTVHFDLTSLTAPR